MAIIRKIYIPLSTETNADKLHKVEAMHREWKRTLDEVFRWYWKIFLRHGHFASAPELAKRIHGEEATIPPTQLVACLKDTMVNAVAGLCKSWASNASRSWSKRLPKHLETIESTCTGNFEHIRHQVLWINQQQSWCKSATEVQKRWDEYQQKETKKSSKSKGTPIPWDPQSLDIARTWFDDQLHRGLRKKPSPKGIPVYLHQNAYTWYDNPNVDTPWKKLHAPAWIKISTLEHGIKTEIPMMYNAYWHRRTQGVTKVHKTATLEKRDGRWYIGRTFELPKKTLAKNPMSTDILGLDLGLNHRLATSQGQLLGRGWLSEVVRWDNKLLALQQRLQKSGVKRLSESVQYRNMTRRIRVATETGLQHALNYVIHTYTPDTLVIEDLDLKNLQEHVSKPMARRLARMGTGIMKRHLTLKAEEYGFAVEVVDSSYTSQMCHACGYTDKNNRAGDAFACGKCGYRDHADINAAKNIQECFLDETLAPGTRGRRTKSQLQARWVARQQACSSGVSGQDPCVMGHAHSCDSTQTQEHALPCAPVISMLFREDGMLNSMDEHVSECMEQDSNRLNSFSTLFSD